MKFIRFIFRCVFLLMVCCISKSFATDITPTGNLTSQTYATDENIITQNPCTINTGVNVVFATDMKTYLNGGFTVKSGGTLTVMLLDNDGLPNVWEMAQFGSYDLYGADDDPDGDGLTNAMELQIGTQALVSDIAVGEAFPDTDGDGMSDVWELVTFGDLDETADGDPDHDGLVNIVEFTRDFDLLEIQGDLLDQSVHVYEKSTIKTKGTTTVNSGVDTLCKPACVMTLNPGFSVKPGGRFTVLSPDKDGLSNAWEMFWFGDLDESPDGDYDQDGLSNADEEALSLNPDNPDTDGDGYNDFVEVTLGTSPADIGDMPVPGRYYQYNSVGRIKSIINVH